LCPYFSENDMVRKKRFYADTKYALEITSEIRID
jgi:hypothetical protein